MEIKIIKMGINGEGIGYINNKPTFVNGAFPDETIEIKIIKDNKTYQIAECIKIVEPSSSRIRSRCKDHECQVCPLIAMDYPQQLIQKQAIITQALYKYAGIKSKQIDTIVANPLPLGYRNQLKLPLNMKDNKLVSGMYQPQSNQFVYVKKCVVHQDNLEFIKDEILRVLNKYKQKSYDQRTKKGLRYLIVRGVDDQFQCTLVKGIDELSEAMLDELADIEGLCSIYQSQNTSKRSYDLFGNNLKRLRNKEYINVRLEQFKYRLSPTAFFQLNHKQAINIYRYVVDHVAKDSVVVDAYCGIGSMSLYIAKKAKKVIGIENNQEAINDARYNTSINNCINCEFIFGDAADKLKGIVNDVSIDVLIINPPRSGLGEEMIETILRSKIKQLIYVSCNPSTLAKNIDNLRAKYQVDKIMPFDMFSHTPLVESVTTLFLKR